MMILLSAQRSAVPARGLSAAGGNTYGGPASGGHVAALSTPERVGAI